MDDYRATPRFSPIVPILYLRYSIEGGNPDGCERHWDARERLISARHNKMELSLWKSGGLGSP